MECQGKKVCSKDHGWKPYVTDDLSCRFIVGERGYPGADCVKGLQGPKGVPGLRGEPGKFREKKSISKTKNREN